MRKREEKRKDDEEADEITEVLLLEAMSGREVPGKRQRPSLPIAILLRLGSRMCMAIRNLLLLLRLL